MSDKLNQLKNVSLTFIPVGFSVPPQFLTISHFLSPFCRIYLCFFCFFFILIFLFLSACLCISLPITFSGSVERRSSQTIPFTSYQIGHILLPYHPSVCLLLCISRVSSGLKADQLISSVYPPLPTNLSISLLMLSLSLSCSVLVNVNVLCLCFLPFRLFVWLSLSLRSRR